MRNLAWSRLVIIAVHAMILLTTALLFMGSRADKPLDLRAWVLVFVPPAIAILAAIVPRSRRQRFVAYLAAAILMVPAAGFGIFGGWGLLYMIGIVFLLFTAWQENEGKTMI